MWIKRWQNVNKPGEFIPPGIPIASRELLNVQALLHKLIWFWRKLSPIALWQVHWSWTNPKEAKEREKNRGKKLPQMYPMSFYLFPRAVICVVALNIIRVYTHFLNCHCVFSPRTLAIQGEKIKNKREKLKNKRGKIWKGICNAYLFFGAALTKAERFREGICVIAARLTQELA